MRMTKTTLSTAIAAAKEAGRIYQQASKAHDAAHERLMAAQPPLTEFSEVRAAVPAPPELVLDPTSRAAQRYDIVMTRRYEDGREVTIDIPWQPSATIVLNTEHDIEQHFATDPTGRAAALSALSRWEAAQDAAVAAKWPEYARLDALSDAAEKEWEAALDLFEDRLGSLLRTPVATVDEANTKLQTYLRLNADLYAGTRQWKGRHHGDMTRFIESDRAREVLSVLATELAGLAAGRGSAEPQQSSPISGVSTQELVAA